jgi:hypothetical protein
VRDVTDGDRSVARVALHHARDELSELAHIPGIVSHDQELAYDRIQLHGPCRRHQLVDEMLREHENVVLTLPQRNCATTPASDTMEEISTEMHHKSHSEGLDANDRERYRIENLHLYFDYLNLSHPMVRSVVLWAYVVGFGLLAIPSLEVFGKVAWLLCKMVF